MSNHSPDDGPQGFIPIDPDQTAEFFERHVDAYSGGGDYGEDDYSEYRAGWEDGYAFGKRTAQPTYRLRRFLTTKMRRLLRDWCMFKNRFRSDSDIPF